jgi:hypothetical protein
MLAGSERIARLRNLDRPELPGPFENVLENMVVDSLKAPGIERPRKWLVSEMAKAARGSIRFA